MVVWSPRLMPFLTMTDQQHPITPPPALVRQWINENDDLTEWHVATQAARWGADQELEACCEWFSEDPPAVAQGLRAARRPNWPSQAEEALKALDSIASDLRHIGEEHSCDVIYAALERLRELEAQ